MTSTPDAEAVAGRLDDQLCFALYAAMNAMTRTYRPLLGELGLTYTQYLVLVVLWEERSCPVGKLAERLQLASHAISPISERLERAGLVRKVADPIDGRVVHLELTQAGARLESAAARVQDDVWCATELPRDEVDNLRTQLVQLTAQLSGE